MTFSSPISLSVNTELVQNHNVPLAQNGEVEPSVPPPSVLSPSSFNIVITQTFSEEEQNTQNSPKSLSKRTIKRQLNLGFRSRLANPNSGVEEEKKYSPELNSVASQSFNSRSHVSPNTLGATLNYQHQYEENALKKMNDDLLALTVSSDFFEKQIDNSNKLVTVGSNDFKFADSKLKNVFIKREVGKQLSVAINCFDPKGNLRASGLGVFDELEIDQFVNGDHKSKFRKFLDTAIRTKTHLMILIAGMHDRKRHSDLTTEIKKYYPTKFLVLLNPWLVPENAKERSDYELLEEYLRGELGCTFKIINKDGQVFLADESLDATKDYVKFKEGAFEIWKNSLQNPLLSKNNREHHYKVMRLTEFIYRNRKFYGHISKIKMLLDLCFEKDLSLEDILNDSRAFDHILKSDRLRNVFYYFVDKKLKSSASIHHGLYQETKRKILETSALKLMRWLDNKSQLSPKAIKKHFVDLFPGTFQELCTIESAYLWLHSDSGKAVNKALNDFYSAVPVDL